MSENAVSSPRKIRNVPQINTTIPRTETPVERLASRISAISTSWAPSVKTARLNRMSPASIDAFPRPEATYSKSANSGNRETNA